ncbi:MAG: hypothetical protein CYPHOPRED_004505, partial [Cyphobasidiales sp. Tagirdzhanova-0007]
ITLPAVRGRLLTTPDRRGRQDSIPARHILSNTTQYTQLSWHSSSSHYPLAFDAVCGWDVAKSKPELYGAAIAAVALSILWSIWKTGKATYDIEMLEARAGQQYKAGLAGVSAAI